MDSEVAGGFAAVKAVLLKRLQYALALNCLSGVFQA